MLYLKEWPVFRLFVRFDDLQFFQLFIKYVRNALQNSTTGFYFQSVVVVFVQQTYRTFRTFRVEWHRTKSCLYSYLYKSSVWLLHVLRIDLSYRIPV